MNVESASVDAQEVARFEKIAALWWNPTGPFWPLHRLNEWRAQYLREVLAAHFGLDGQSDAPLKGLSILDIGCGGGLLSEAMARLGADVHGIDVVARNVAIAQRHAGEQSLSIRYEAVAAETLAGQGAAYDVVLNMEVVEHVVDLPAFMSVCAQLVRPGGLMTVATLNRTPLSFLFAIVGAEYVLRWLPRGTHSWRKFPKPEEVEKLLTVNGMRLKSRIGVQMNPFTRQFRRSQCMAVNYLLIAGK